jgi:hypothetical protein
MVAAGIPVPANVGKHVTSSLQFPTSPKDNNTINHDFGIQRDEENESSVIRGESTLQQT